MKKEIEVWMVVDEDGNLELGADSKEAWERFNDNIGTAGESGTRAVKITVTVNLPVPIEVEGEAVEEEQTVA